MQPISFSPQRRKARKVYAELFAVLRFHSGLCASAMKFRPSSRAIPKAMLIVFLVVVRLLICNVASAESLNTTTLQTQTENRININTASAEELSQLPGIGPGFAARIIAHRQKHGAFKRPQDLIIIRGFSAKRFRQIAHLIRI